MRNQPPAAPVPPSAWQFAGVKEVFRFQPPRMAHQQLYLDGRPLVRVAASPADEALPPLAPLEWCLWRGHVYFRIEAGKWIDDYPLWHTLLPVGITLYHVRNAAVTNLVVQGFQLDGINAHDRCENVLFDNVSSLENGRAGLVVGGTSDVSVRGGELAGNAEDSLRIVEYGEATVTDTTYDSPPRVVD